MERQMIDEKKMKEMAKRVCNWGKWGKEDEIGTLNYVTPDCLIRAGKLVKKGMVFQLGMNLDRSGPQNGSSNERYNPIHTMLWSGSDALSGRELYHHPAPEGHDPVKPWYSTNFADDLISMPLQCATHWDALAHICGMDEALLWSIQADAVNPELTSMEPGWPEEAFFWIWHATEVWNIWNRVMKLQQKILKIVQKRNG